MKIKLALLALVCAGAAAGCATTGNFKKIFDQTIGQPESALVSHMGPPQNLYVAPDGTRILSYNKSSNMQLGGGTVYQPVTATTTGNVYGSRGGSATYNTTTTTSVPVQQPTYNIGLSCTIHFTIVNGVIVRWRSEGNNCVG